MNSKLSIKQFEAVIFDMDGVLIDSEPLWKIAMEKVFSDLGCNLSKNDFQNLKKPKSGKTNQKVQ